MAVAPRALIVTRPTEYDEMLGRHGSRQQVAFFLDQRGQDIAELDERHGRQQVAVQTVSASIPVDWRRARLERVDLDRFVFGPEDVVLAVGQDGLVANVAKYLDGQPVLGVNPDAERNPGVLVRHSPDQVRAALADIAAGRRQIEPRTMVEVSVDDGQRLRALNEIFIGHPAHQSAKYTIHLIGSDLSAEPSGPAGPGRGERHSSSGVLIGTGTGSTGWCSSIHRERDLPWDLPGPQCSDLAWFVREAWPSPWTGTTLTSGRLDGGELVIRCESDRLVAFGDGIESDRIELGWGQEARVHVAGTSLSLV